MELGRPVEIQDAPEGEQPLSPRAHDDKARQHLEALQEAITKQTTFTARLVRPQGTDFTYLRVFNPDAAKLAEDVGCRIEDDGDHWFWWSWGNTIAPADDIDGTVKAIKRVIGSGG
ncbi:hypothetical protein [Thermomonospora umbrina]|uniref:Uncharacterized protein n=1 Tax=Thermomonospora umbrina TaxID=111806 RepID=A0A3D9SPI7_9ACTN|nr:hypothetical protein [Thermomonospora umbrina]REE97849.1 hypothetical protein DFJ69_3324 [Thermomonospora umbrina]